MKDPMALRRSAAAALFAIATFMLPACSQIGSRGGGGSVSFSYGMSGTGLKGLPFSAEFVSQTVQTLSDGTHITHQQKQVQARDSQGRTRNELYSQDAAGADSGPGQLLVVIIMDPVSGQFIHLSPQQKTATVNPAFAAKAGPPPAAPKESVSQPVIHRSSSPHQISTEKLGGETIDGVYAEGTRTTEVIRAGTDGNDRDITVVTEKWVSPDLKIEVRSKKADPRSGERTTEVRNLDRGEPDPALFQIPPDYKVQTQPTP
jgi:hypothetical protein